MADIIRWDPFREIVDMRRDWESVFDKPILPPADPERLACSSCGHVSDG
jgi:hypothetical protein